MMIKRSCDVFYSLFYICLILGVCNTLYGCSSKKDYVANSEEFINDLTEQVEAEIADGRKSNEVEISFRQACIEAAQNDKSIRALLEKLEQAQVEVEGVNTHLWPRLKLSANSDIPLSSADNVDFDLSGGLYLDYDIRKAISTNDETTLRKAAVDQNVLKLRMAIGLLQGKVKKLLNQISLLNFKVKKKAQALKISRDSFQLAKIYASENKLNSLNLASWKKRVDSLEIELLSLQNQLKGQRFALSDLLGRNVEEPISIIDAGQTITINSSPKIAKITPALVWKNHTEARLYELELIAAEAAVQLIALERLPQIDAELGIGDIPLEKSESASSLLRLTVAFPVYDFGDHSRKLAKTQISRDRVRKSLKSKITKLYNRAQMASIAHANAKDHLKQATSTLEESKELIERKKILISESRADNLGLYPDLISSINLEIFQQEALLNVERTAVELRFATGEDTVDDSIVDIIKDL